MLLTPTQVETEFLNYGLIAVGDPIVGVEGLIKNAALTVSSLFIYKGEKTDVESIYAFPRSGISESNPDSFTPDCIYEAQLYVLVQDKANFLVRSYNRDFEASFTNKAGGLYQWVQTTIKSYPEIEARLRSMLARYITTGDGQCFESIKGGSNVCAAHCYPCYYM